MGSLSWFHSTIEFEDENEDEPEESLTEEFFPEQTNSPPQIEHSEETAGSNLEFTPRLSLQSLTQDSMEMYS